MLGPKLLILASAALAPLALQTGVGSPARETVPGPQSGSLASSSTSGKAGSGTHAATSLYFGDVHVHTSYSPDASINGTEKVSPDQAYRFAKGEEVVADNGMKARLNRPLDFLAVTDHAEFMGVHARLASRDPALATWSVAQRWAELIEKGDRAEYFQDMLRTIQRDAPEDRLPDSLKRSIWEDVAATAERHNQPGRFTALIGYEWTSTVAGDNLHRNVLFRGNASDVAGMIPFSSQDSRKPEDLWAFLADYEANSGSKVLAIPHNSNVSNGRMFAPTMSDGAPFTKAYASARARWEPVVEITQMKGDSEAHPSLSPTDEFADFENWDTTNLFGNTPKQPWMLQYEYVRSALGLGLGYEQELGANPFKLGIIGSTDTHTGLAATDEKGFFGKFKGSEPGPDRALGMMGPTGPENWRIGASGLAAVWATANTREAIFDAFARREVYGTTGSRIQVRFFGGWNFTKRDVARPDYAEIGYARGVPMGGDLLRQKGRKAPRFMVLAARDPDGANLDRIQVIKGWVDKHGKVQNRIFDVALSDSRKVDPRTGKAPPVGSTVDLRTASYTNTIGATQLSAVWTDPEFDPQARAFYYVRVLEIPTPRWTAYDMVAYGLKLPPEIPLTVQDRAYTSPIWYNP
ncbi:MAG: DUF3604 domain-containing protein [Novosphingobium sp.]|nr:DUF3604 domain-containing protein [Novosphingobium sp.]